MRLGKSGPEASEGERHLLFLSLLAGATGVGGHVVVTTAKRRWLDEHLERQWRRPPTVEESDRFVSDFVREEVLYREALALGLDRDDLVVRRRLVQKMEMLAIQEEPQVTESDLREFYAAHQADYIVPASATFRHVFFSSTARGAEAGSAAETALLRLRDGEAPESVGGDRPPMPREMTEWTWAMVAERFGSGFAPSVFEASTGEWAGPVRSVYGYHLLLVVRRVEARVPDFAELADRVATDLDTARRIGALDRIYARVRDSYVVDIEPAAEPMTAGHVHEPGHGHDHWYEHSDEHALKERARS
jgi:PPIC-type PPIASE domain